MQKSIVELINNLKDKVDSLEKENTKLKKKQLHLSTTLFDARYTIKQLKDELRKSRTSMNNDHRQAAWLMVGPGSPGPPRIYIMKDYTYKNINRMFTTKCFCQTCFPLRFVKYSSDVWKIKRIIYTFNNSEANKMFFHFREIMRNLNG